jgi:L-2-hydroxyglutarate oxidase
LSTQYLTTDFLIIGGGIIGLCMAKNVKERFPDKKIVILEKESSLGFHASGRNSGVLHAGFYYAANTLKAQFTLEGNRAWKVFCKNKGLALNENGKVVVAANASEIEAIHTLYQRGLKNGIPLQLISEKELASIEPNAKTCEVALYSPETATVSPSDIIEALQLELTQQGVEIMTGEAFVKRLSDGCVLTSKQCHWQAQKVINTAGLYADTIAKDFGFCQNYTIMPFKGLYLKYTGPTPPVKVNVYPVPDLSLPFLGVHFTVTVNNEVKIGPTAMPAFWRENYGTLERFNFSEMKTITQQHIKLFIQNRFQFRAHALGEMKKIYKPYFVAQAKGLLKSLDSKGFQQWTNPGIRAQLLNTQTGQLLTDFVIEQDKHSLHILNAVSPAFTCAIPFTRWICEKYL